MSTDDEIKVIHNQIEHDLRKNNNISTAFIVSINDVAESVDGLKRAQKDGENDMLTSDYFIHADSRWS